MGTRFFGILLIGLIMGCKTQQGVMEGTINPQFKLKDIIEKSSVSANYTQLKISGVTKIENNSSVPNLQLTYYNEKDEKIWMNIAVSFISMARANIDQDTLKAYEKANKTYMVKDFSYVQEFLGLDFMNLSALEKLFIGRNFIPLDTKQYSLQVDSLHYTIASKSAISFQNNTSEKYHVKMLLNSDFTVQSILVSQQNGTNELFLEYKNYVQTEKLPLPQKVKISLKGKKNMEISLEYNNFDFEKSNTPFNIPNGYTEREIKM